ncbi:DUF2271 domain-containing protein [Solimonas terrae]|uniref:DUF2271 domain-containing protein n=1 Tax=Solimonas terrae TaxID=1396819 RepID=A0A6M2BYF4_9GAMM|nr:DUF2271 domain-containing protein [Solimonas terrae]NGY06827.1 DUF2271 domain-containing protein [Solimonas terrae]
MRASLSIVLCGLGSLGPLAAAPARAADLDIRLQIPQLDVAEYHRPYVAAWLERPDQSVAANLAVWYDLRKRDHEGEKYLKDLRQWWRRSGRDLQMPADGISGATRAVGDYELKFVPGEAPLAALPAGDYQLVVEAARESGGRELLKIPFSWPVQKASALQAQGNSELGTVTLALRP